jgi:HEAT repeat protein
MRWIRALPVLFTFWFLLLTAGATAADPAAIAADEKVLKGAFLATDGPSLLTFLKERTHPSTSTEKVADLVKQLGDKTPAVADKAAGQLVALGTVSVPLLRQAVKDPDEAEVARRARICLQNIEGASGASVPVAVTRLLTVRQPAGAVEALLDYLPFADDEHVTEEVQEALKTLAVDKGKPAPALLKALSDSIPIRRAAAAEALAQPSAYLARPAVRKLLQDQKATVRLRVALALAADKEQEAIPVLIASLGELPQEQGRKAEEVLLNLAGALAPGVPLGPDALARKKCRNAWDKWWKETDGKALLAYFRERTLPDADEKKLEDLVAQLGDNVYKIRQQASADLIAYRHMAKPFLEKALKNSVLEIRKRAEVCLEKINAAPGADKSAARARLLALRRPEGAAAALLGFVPFAEEQSVNDEIRDALASLAVEEGKPSKNLVAALSDQSPLRRTIAAEALCQAGLIEPRPTIRKLLKDKEPEVRFRVALALSALKEKESIPVLINSLADVPASEAWQAEEVLRRLASNLEAPSEALGTSEESQKKARKAWVDWWKNNEKKVDLTALEGRARLLGYTLLSHFDPNGRTFQLTELGVDKKPRWTINNLQFLYDARVISENRVLLAEANNQRVTERNFKGDILWEIPFQFPINVQRLSNGNTFVAGRNQIAEFDRNKKQIYRIDRQAFEINAAQKLSDGTIGLILTRGVFVRIDTSGKELKQFNIGPVTFLGALEALPRGHILVCQQVQNRVVEYDADGKEVWSAKAQSPISASRLPNGHTLVTSQQMRTVTELDRAGNTVWSHTTEGFPYRARRR